MKTGELKKYLDKFPDDVHIGIVLANPRDRKLYKVENIIAKTDQTQPVFCIDVGEEIDMDAELGTACKECKQETDDLEGQMRIEDFPEVMP